MDARDSIHIYIAVNYMYRPRIIFRILSMIHVARGNHGHGHTVFVPSVAHLFVGSRCLAAIEALPEVSRPVEPHVARKVRPEARVDLKDAEPGIR